MATLLGLEGLPAGGVGRQPPPGQLGLPPGEVPATSVARELLEETGYTAKNVRPAGVGPLQIDWPAMDEALLSEKQRERC